MALAGEEGRDKLRKAPGSGTCALIRRCPNGVTRRAKSAARRIGGGPTRGTETSHYPEEKKIRMIPPVAASERGGAQTGGVFGPWPGL